MRTALITGAQGALAHAVTRHLEQVGGFRIVATSRNSGEHRLDVSDASQLQAVLADIQPDLIFNLAATFSSDYGEAYRINVDATRRLLDVVERHHSNTRVLLVGSAAEYGAVLPEDNPIREDHPTVPQSVYGLSKVWQTQLACFYALRGVKVVVARVFNLDAPNLSDRLFIGRVQAQIKEIRSGKRVALEFGPLDATRDYVDAENAARQVVCIATRGIAGQVYNVGSGEAVVMRDLLHRRLALEGLSHVSIQEGKSLTNRTGFDAPAIYADMTKTLALLKHESETC